MKTFPPPFDVAEESSYLRKMSNGDVAARNQLIIRNMRLVAHIAKKYQNTNEEMDELISIGTIGLIKAVNTYDGKKGSRLVTYAARCIDNELLMYMRAKKKISREVSLYEPIGTDKEGNQIQLVDIVESNGSEVFEEVYLKKNVRLLYRVLPELLTKREQEIIKARYGLYNKKPVTQREIAKKLGISRSYVSRIEKKAIEKLRNSFVSQ
ncbi:MAG: RNA polymerase sporulation sigma factor SigK [Eubacterium sp.]|nr:RNA polymerase sporulation sigma factor SigK [Eubacterium sp.]